VVRGPLVDTGLAVGLGAAEGLEIAAYECGALEGTAAIVIVTSSSSSGELGSVPTLTIGLVVPLVAD
jgi:hypothetical protein